MHIYSVGATCFDCELRTEAAVAFKRIRYKVVELVICKHRRGSAANVHGADDEAVFGDCARAVENVLL